MKQNVGQVSLDLILNSSQFKTQLDRSVKTAVSSSTKNSTGMVTRSFGKMGKAAAVAFAATAFIKFGKESIKLGSDLAEVQNVVDVTFGEMSEDINQFAQDAMKNYGLSETVAKKYAGTYGSMAKSFGFTTVEAAKMSKQLTGLAGDVASFRNISSDEAYVKLKSVFTGETETLKELGVVMTQVALDQYALQKGYNKTTKQMTEQEKVALRFAFVQEKLSLMSGDFIRTQKGWANQTRILKLQWDSFKATMGQALINVLTPLLQSLNIIMIKMIQFAKVFKDFTISIFGDRSGSTQAGAISDDMMSLTENTENAGDAAVGTAKKIQKSLMGFDELNKLSENIDSGNAGSGFGIGEQTIPNKEENGSEKTVGAISKAKTELKEMFEIIKEGFKNGISGFNTEGIKKDISGIKDTVSTIFNNEEVKTALNKYEKTVLNTFGRIIGNITNIGGTIAEYFAGSLNIAMKKSAPTIQKTIIEMLDISARIQELKGKLAEALKEIFSVFKTQEAKEFGGTWISNLITAFSILWKIIGRVKEKIMEIFTTLIGDNKEELYELLKSVIELMTFIGKRIGTILHFIQVTGDMVYAIFGPMISWLSEKFSGAIGGLIEILTGVIQFITGVFSLDWGKAWEGNLNIFKGFADNSLAFWNLDCDKIWEKAKTLGTNLTGGAKNVATQIKDFFVNGFKLLIELLKEPINSMISMINKMIDGINKMKISIPDWVPNAGGKEIGVSVPKIPMLAQGGFVRANTPQLAMIGDNRHEGEIVAPESKISGAVANEIMPVLSLLQQLITQLGNRNNDEKDVIVNLQIGSEQLDPIIQSAERRKALRTGGR